MCRRVFLAPGPVAFNGTTERIRGLIICSRNQLIVKLPERELGCKEQKHGRLLFERLQHQQVVISKRSEKHLTWYIWAGGLEGASRLSLTDHPSACPAHKQTHRDVHNAAWAAALGFNIAANERYDQSRLHPSSLFRAERGLSPRNQAEREEWENLLSPDTRAEPNICITARQIRRGNHYGGAQS